MELYYGIPNRSFVFVLWQSASAPFQNIIHVNDLPGETAVTWNICSVLLSLLEGGRDRRRGRLDHFLLPGIFQTIIYIHEFLRQFGPRCQKSSLMKSMGRLFFKKSYQEPFLGDQCISITLKHVISTSQINRDLLPTSSLYMHSLEKIHPLEQTLEGAGSQWLPGELVLSG